MRPSGRPAMAAIAGMIALVGTLAAAAPSGAAAASPLVAVTASAAPALPSGAQRLGELPAGTRLHLDVTLKVRDQAALTALLNGLADRNSPYFDHFLQPGQFGPLFGPTLEQVAAVKVALTAAGLTPGTISEDRLDIPVTATAAEAERAFGIRLVGYRLPGGRVAYANASAPRLPASVTPLVGGVLGLDDLYASDDGVSVEPSREAASTSQPGGSAVAADPAAATASPRPCAAATGAAAPQGSFTTDQLAQHYGLSPLYQLGDLGQGVKIAMLDEESYLASDIAGYESCYGVHTPVSAITVAGPAPAVGRAGTLVIEQMASLAPDARIDVYETSATADPEFELISRAVSLDHDQVIIDQYYTCELGVNVSLAQSEEFLAEEANAQGQTMLMDAGLGGSTACAKLDSANEAKLAVATLAALPYDVAVGGSTLSGDTPLAPETVYNEEGNGASGGGRSALWCMPPYQDESVIPGLISGDSATRSSCSDKGRYVREVPDISADADPYTGYIVYYQGEWLGGMGGTALGEAVVAAIAAVIDASPFCADYRADDPGLLPQALYKFVASDPYYVYRGSLHQVSEAVEDIVSGNNDYLASGYRGGLYPATAGYDMATGLGVPLVSGLAAHISGPVSQAPPSTFYPGLAAGLCQTMGRNVGVPAVTRVTPNAGPAGRAITVTVSGKHFLPIAGADKAKVFVSLTQSFVLPADCKSAAVCTVRLPALAARTVNIQITAENSAYSGYVKADRFTYAPVPRIAKISPAKGKPGTKVVIHGTGFVAVKGVYFGGRKGIGATVVSTTEITVLAPAGSGTVKLTVITGGGAAKATFAY
jgi:subtilase family serine protease